MHNFHKQYKIAIVGFVSIFYTLSICLMAMGIFSLKEKAGVFNVIMIIVWAIISGCALVFLIFSWQLNFKNLETNLEYSEKISKNVENSINKFVENFHKNTEKEKLVVTKDAMSKQSLKTAKNALLIYKKKVERLLIKIEENNIIMGENITKEKIYKENILETERKLDNALTLAEDRAREIDNLQKELSAKKYEVKTLLDLKEYSDLSC